MENKDQLIAELKQAFDAALGWVDAVPEATVATLLLMPGFDRDWADELLTETW